MKIISGWSVLVGFVATIVAGLPISNALGHDTWTKQWWGIEVLSFVLVALVTEWFIHRFMSPISIGDELPSRAARFTEEVREASWNFCAISSKWLALWQSSTFMYYLHVNTVRNLTAYTARVRAPLERISTDTKEKHRFYEEGLQLAANIAQDIEVPHFFGLRLLVYRDQVYQNPQTKDQIISLIQAQALGRVHCIPLVLEKLEKLVELGEREELRAFSSLLQYQLKDSLPPESLLSIIWRKITREEKRQLLVPDFLIVNNAKSPIPHSNVWWYLGSVPKGDSKVVPQATKAFSILCSKVPDALWDGFTADTIEAVPVAAPTIQFEEEAFFSLPYFRNWLGWIKKNPSVEAELLNSWLSAEDELLRRILKPGSRVLDVGCGFGRHAQLMISDCQAELVVGVDLNPSMIIEARKLSEQFGPDKVQLFLDDAATLSSCKDGYFDVVICMTNTLGNMRPEKRKQCLEQMKRVVNSEGKILISVYNDTGRSIQLRSKSYVEVGLHIIEQVNVLIAREGLRSEHFSGSRLIQLIQNVSLICEQGPSELDHIGTYVVAKKPRT